MIDLHNINRIEFVMTNACTGACKHCSEGGHRPGPHIDGAAGARFVREAAARFSIASCMTFGGEPLLFAKDVCAIHAAATRAGIAKRQLITNGFFSRDEATMARVAGELAQAGVNDVLLSVDAFHQQTIPLPPVQFFAQSLRAAGVPVRLSPAWLVSPEDDNPWNEKTRAVLGEFADFPCGEGNVIFPAGNALLHLGEYFVQGAPPNPYVEDPLCPRTLSVCADGSVLGGSIYGPGFPWGGDVPKPLDAPGDL